MTRLNCALLGDGSFDRNLIPVLKWLIHNVSDKHQKNIEIEAFNYLDISMYRIPDKTLKTRIACIIEGKEQGIFDFNLLFVHRDAETEVWQMRRNEIEQAIQSTDISIPWVAVVPVRMTEAWLLLEEHAIRKAAGNRNGSMSLNIPAIRTLERLPDPKQELYDLLRQASGARGRDLKKFNAAKAAHLVAEYISDYTPLYQLPAFAQLEIELEAALNNFISHS